MNDPGPDDDHPGEIVRFSLAGLEVLLRSPDDALATLPSSYADEPAGGGAPGLVVEVRHQPGFGEGRTMTPIYPAFARSRRADGGIHLARPDAEGDLDVPEDATAPIRGRFVVGDDRHSLEAVIRASASVAIPRRGGLILHGSAVEYDGAADVFSGVSGAGKSTISTILGALPGVTKIADELLIVMPDAAGTFTLHTVPFISKERLPARRGLALRRWHALVQAPVHRRERLAPAAATRELLRHVLVHVAEPRTAGATLAAALAFTSSVPCHRLEFAKDPGVAEVLGIT